MFNDRLSFTLDLFHIDNEDLLMTISKSPSSGYLDQLANVGTLRNRGIEFSINATPVRTIFLPIEIILSYSTGMLMKCII